MTIYMVTKTIQWVTRAKVNAWFRLAFNLSGSEHSSRSATPTFTSSPSQQRTDLIMRRRSHTGVTTAKKFYELEAKDPKEVCRCSSRITLSLHSTPFQRGLTLEPRYKFSTPDLPPTRFDSKTVPTMMRRSSGFWSEEFTQRVHETLFKESMEMTRATSEMQLKENVEK